MKYLLHPLLCWYAWGNERHARRLFLYARFEKRYGLDTMRRGRIIRAYDPGHWWTF